MRSEGENLQHVSLKETQLLPHATKRDEFLSVAKQKWENKEIKEGTWHEGWPAGGELFSACWRSEERERERALRC